MADVRVSTQVPPTPDPDSPEVENSAALGGWIWIVLFGSVMMMSLLANLLMTVCILMNRKKQSVIYFLLILMFVVNLIDYSLLIFEFTLGMGHEYPYSESSCTLYQMLIRGNPIVQAAAVLVLIHYASGMYGSYSQADVSSPCDSPNPTRNRTKSLIIFFSIATGLFLLEAVFSIPTAYFASIVSVDGRNYCEIDLGKVAPVGAEQKTISVFYLLYSSIFSYWLPLGVAILPMVRLYRSPTNCDKFQEVSVVLATASSFFFFFFFHGIVVTSRHLLDASGVQLSAYQSWMIKVAQSSMWLIGYFWHFTRPALTILLDQELKFEVARMIGRVEYSSIDINGAKPESEARFVQLSVTKGTLNQETLSLKNSEMC